jgi:hypothetical protein
MVRQSGRLGQTIATHTTHNQIGGRRYVDEMTWRDEKRLDAIAGSQDGSDRTIFQHEWRAVAALRARPGMLAAQSTFGAADGRPAKPQPQMACQSEVAGMRYALPIHQNNVGHCLELSKSFQHHRQLSERQ